MTGQRGPCAGNTGEIPRLGIPRMCYQDGPAGVRPAIGNTQFPSGVTTAATWDVDLIYARSRAMGQEFYDLGVHVAMSMVTGKHFSQVAGSYHLPIPPQVAHLADRLSVAVTGKDGM